LVDLLDKVTDYIDKNRIGVGIFIDLSEAFDTINHHILLKKLEHYAMIMVYVALLSAGFKIILKNILRDSLNLSESLQIFKSCLKLYFFSLYN